MAAYNCVKVKGFISTGVFPSISLKNSLSLGVKVPWNSQMPLSTHATKRMILNFCIQNSFHCFCNK